jgi:hypothetical protein
MRVGESPWTQEQRTAIVAAVLDHGDTLPYALARSKAGQLAGLAPFDPPYSTAHSWITAERERRAGEPTIDELLDTAITRGVRLCERRLRTLQRLDALTPEQTTELRGLAVALRGFRRAAAPTQPTRDEIAETTEPPGFVTQLAAAQQAEESGFSLDRQDDGFAREADADQLAAAQAVLAGSRARA